MSEAKTSLTQQVESDERECRRLLEPANDDPPPTRTPEGPEDQCWANLARGLLEEVNLWDTVTDNEPVYVLGWRLKDLTWRASLRGRLDQLGRVRAWHAAAEWPKHYRVMLQVEELRGETASHLLPVVALSTAAAVDDALRFYLGRAREQPEHFARLVGLEVGHHVGYAIAEDGTPRGGPPPPVFVYRDGAIHLVDAELAATLPPGTLAGLRAASALANGG